MEYKGVEYVLLGLAPDKWSWIFFPKIRGELPRGGEVTGSREHAEIACMRAINQWRTSAMLPSSPLQKAEPPGLLV
jgi:hypothetical protein